LSQCENYITLEMTKKLGGELNYSITEETEEAVV
jgi:hypothetical protein